MKKTLLFFVFALVLNSCSKDDHRQDEVVYNGEVLPVVSYVMPTTYAVDVVSTITLRYKIPTTCYAYDGIYYDRNGMTRTVGIATYQYNRSGCQTDGLNIYEASLNFKPALSGTYNFKFFTGTNSAGVDQFALETVVVP
jgi:hypothetical protein